MRSNRWFFQDWRTIFIELKLSFCYPECLHYKRSYSKYFHMFPVWKIYRVEYIFLFMWRIRYWCCFRTYQGSCFKLNFGCQFLHVRFISVCHTSDVGLGQLSIVSYNLCIQNNEVPFWCHFVFGWSIKIKFYNWWPTCKFCYGMVSFLAHWNKD